MTKTDLEKRGMYIPEVRYREEIDRFVEQDRTAPPTPGGILFAGDSDIRFWTFDNRFALDFEGLPVLNRGFGGARTWEMLVYFDELILPGQPRVVVYCCGDNDIACLGLGGVDSAVKGFEIFMERVAADAPSVERVLYLGIHPSPADEPFWQYIEQANVRLRKICDGSALAEFVDFSALLLNDQGRPDPAMFRPDRLHFNAVFYQRLAACLRPKLEHGEPGT